MIWTMKLYKCTVVAKYVVQYIRLITVKMQNRVTQGNTLAWWIIMMHFQMFVNYSSNKAHLRTFLFRTVGRHFQVVSASATTLGFNLSRRCISLYIAHLSGSVWFGVKVTPKLGTRKVFWSSHLASTTYPNGITLCKSCWSLITIPLKQSLFLKQHETIWKEKNRTSFDNS